MVQRLHNAPCAALRRLPKHESKALSTAEGFDITSAAEKPK